MPPEDNPADDISEEEFWRGLLDADDVNRRAVSLSMCPHCGWLYDNLGGLVPVHRESYVEHVGKIPCDGSHQNPRNPRADRRNLWNGKPNPHLDADGNPLI